MSDIDIDDDLTGEIAVTEAHRLLPAWFVSRMMMDVWHFGLLLSTGQLIAISTIDRLRQDATGDIWLDVTLLAGPECLYLPNGALGLPISFAPTSRLQASIAAKYVVAAIELADT